MLNIKAYPAQRFAILVLWLALAFSAPVVQAHEFSEALADPDGRAHAVKLLGALGSADGNTQDPTFKKLFLSDPKLSKRAYVAALDIAFGLAESDEERAKEAVMGAYLLAQAISEQFGDEQPLRIFERVAQEDPSSPTQLSEYLSSLRADEPPSPLDTARLPLLLKIARADMAGILAHPDVIISELDTLAIVIDQFNATIAAMGLQTGTGSSDDGFTTFLTMYKLLVKAEIGLLDEFESGRQGLEEQPDKHGEAIFLLAGFRAAARQDRIDLASGYLKAARAALAQPGTPDDPVLEYALRTAEFELRRLEGYRPDEASVIASFEKAWSALANYQPFIGEADWYSGRLATRYWIDQIAPYGQSGQPAAEKAILQLASWMSAFEDLKITQLETLEDVNQITAALDFAVAGLDQITYALENYPEELEGLDLKNFESIVQLCVDVGGMYGRLSGPGFPPYEITSGGMVPELLARFRYLNSFSAALSPEAAASLLSESATLVRTTRNPVITVDYLLKIGSRYSALGLHDQALALWKEALELADSRSFVHRGLDAATLLGKEYGRRGDWKSASLYAERASEKLQETAPMLGVRSAEGQEMAQKTQEVTELSVKAAVEADDPEKALAAVTRGQQVQSASLQMEGQTEARAEAQQVVQKEEQVVALTAQVRNLEKMPSSDTRNSLLESTQSLLADTKAKFLSDTRSLRQKYSTLYTQILRFDPLNLPDVQKTLPADVAVVQYFSTDEDLYIFLVTRDNFRLHKVPIGRLALEKSTRDYGRAVRRATPNDAAMLAESRKLYDAIFAPVEKDIAQSSTLVLIPSGRLNSLPFASLTGASGVPLGASKRLLELAKPTDLMRLASETPEPIQSVVAFANATGDLPAASKEGEQIAALFPGSKLFKGKEATREAFVKFGSQADALHVATHGEWNMEDSLANYLAMADQQKVSQDEIFQLGLDETSIVILSACNTAMGDSGDVNYVASLAEAFWIAGSDSVVASLWAVDDQSTSLLMTEFYKSLKAGDGKAEALQKAQMTVRSNEKFAHPYYWSGFILFGDWR